MRLLLSARAVVTVVGTLVLLIVTVVVSDVVAVPGVARDVVRAVGAQLVALAGSAWQRRYVSRKPEQECAQCRGACKIMANSNEVSSHSNSALSLGQMGGFG